jgi:hypothetical protein
VEKCPKGLKRNINQDGVRGCVTGSNPDEEDLSDAEEAE